MFMAANNQCQVCLGECTKGELTVCGACWMQFRNDCLSTGTLVATGGAYCEGQCGKTRAGFQFVCPPCFKGLMAGAGHGGRSINPALTNPYSPACALNPSAGAPILGAVPVFCHVCPGASGGHKLSCPVGVAENGHTFARRPGTNTVECACGQVASYMVLRSGSLRVPPCSWARAAVATTPPVPANYYGVHTTPPTWDLSFDLDPRPTPPMPKARPRCRTCGLDLCTDLDAYYGQDVRGKNTCSPCRKRNGVE